MSTTGDAAPRSVGTRRLVLYYGLLVAVLLVVVAVVATKGSEQHAQPQIAGGYDIAPGTSACLGQQFNVVQSGRFVSVADPQSGAGGKLTFKGNRLTGTLSCADHSHGPADLRYSAGTLAGTIGS